MNIFNPIDWAAWWYSYARLHGDDVNAWIADHRWTLLLAAALLTYLWVRDQKRRGRL